MSKENSQQYQLKDHQVIRTDPIESNIPTRGLFDRCVGTPKVSPLGKIVVRDDIKSLGSTKEGGVVTAEFNVLPEYRTYYPEVVIQALGSLYAEYNRAFAPLVEANREWETDYQYCRTQDGTPINGWVQIDMVGLPESFLEMAPGLGETQVREALRGRIFEIENSIAMYQLLEQIFSSGGQDTFFRRQFRASLDNVRQRSGRPIALLAVTDQKYQAMRQSEFGKREGETLTDEVVRELSGFDRFFGPDDFAQYLDQNGGKCDYLLYARTSDPVAKLKNPNLRVSIPLLENPNTRKVIRANAVTFNIDNPAWVTGDSRRINDTKAWMSAVGMALDVFQYEDIATEGETRDQRGKFIKIQIPSERLVGYLRDHGVDFSERDPREIVLHAKPMQASYGCYGHTRGPLKDGDFRRELKKGLRERGPYVLQPEMQTPVITNLTDGKSFTYIDRNFMWTDGNNYYFMGGFRSLMPLDSPEARKGRNHGSKYTVWAEILPEYSY